MRRRSVPVEKVPQAEHTRKVEMPIPANHDAFKRSLFPFTYNNIRYSEDLLLDHLMLLINREGSFHTESVPDGKLPAGNHRQFRCYCPLGPQKGFGEAGIDSVAEFRV